MGIYEVITVLYSENFEVQTNNICLHTKIIKIKKKKNSFL